MALNMSVSTAMATTASMNTRVRCGCGAGFGDMPVERSVAGLPNSARAGAQRASIRPT